MSVLADIETMEEQGHDQFDPVRFQFIKSLVRRSTKERSAVASILQQKALSALNDYRTRQSRADNTADPHLGEKDDSEENPLRALLSTLELRASNSEQGLQSGELSLTDFLRQQEKEVMTSIGGKPAKQSERASPEELSSVRLFRESLVKLNSDKLVTRVISEGPENPGPLNPQALVIKSLAAMRELSPDYLNRFVSYMDTLLWLEDASAKIRPAKTKKTGKRSRKR